MLSELLESEDELSLELVAAVDEEVEVPVDESELQASVDVPVWEEEANSVDSSALAAELLWLRDW
jgi:hypothetical protein